MKLLRAFTTVGSYTLLSRVFGLVRDIVIARFLGASIISDVFFVAFKIPNFFRRLVAEGAFSAAFVPLFSSQLSRHGREVAVNFAEQVFVLMLLFLAGLLLLAELTMPWFMLIVAPGFKENPEQFNLAVDLARLTFPYLLFISLVALMGGVLNALGRFAAMAAAPILLNVCLIAALLGLGNYTPTYGHALAYGVIAAGLAQFLLLLWASQCADIRFQLKKPKITPEIRKLLKKMLPGVLGAGVFQINVLIDTFLASLLASGSISYLYYADRVSQLPIGVIAVGLGTSLLPILSTHVEKGQSEEAESTIKNAAELGLFLTIPAFIGLLTLASPMIALFFQGGAFTEDSTTQTAWALMAYAGGIPAFVLVKILASSHFARSDTKTPFRIGCVVVVFNLFSNLICMYFFKHVGLALSTTFSAWLQVLLLHRSLNVMNLRFLSLRRVGIMTMSAFLMGGAVLPVHQYLTSYLGSATYQKIISLIIAVSAGAVIYFVLTRLLGVWQLKHLKRHGMLGMEKKGIR